MNNFSEECLEPFDHLRPTVRISPFDGKIFSGLMSTGAAGADSESKQTSVLEPRYWLNSGQQLTFMKSGRIALKQALSLCGVAAKDSVMIVTTTGGNYVSSCVTDVIESMCSWSHELLGNTKAVLIIHEFGFPCVCPSKLKCLGLPIIEDCAYAVGTRMEGGKVGSIGDFAIYSAPKYYPFPFGGILISNRRYDDNLVIDRLSDIAHKELTKLLTTTTNHCAKWNKLRRENWGYFAKELELLGLHEFFDLPNDVVPGVFLLKLKNEEVGNYIKQSCSRAGIESTVYYSQGGYYFPVHQSLTEYDRRYILHHFKLGLAHS